jgi:tRNA pseudouridine55 synthase
MSKSYEAVARLGVETDSLDLEGEVVREVPLPGELDEGRIDEALAGLTGDIEQVPPQFSAKKVEGEAMHRRARRGEAVELAPVAVTVHELVRTRWSPPELGFTVRCSSGTYVRALARDLGAELGVGAHLTGLRRTAVGDHSVADALTVEELEDPDAVAGAAMTPAAALGHLPAVDLTESDERAIRFGQAIGPGDETAGREGPIRMVREGRLVGVGEWTERGLQPRVVLPAPQPAGEAG